MSEIAEKILAALEAEIVARGGRLADIKIYTAGKYGDEIRKNAAAYWQEGVAGSFISRMNQTIKFGLRDAWSLAADDLGIAPDEITPEELKERDAIITEEQSHVRDLLAYLKELANDRTRKLSDADARLDLWAERFGDMQNKAKLILGRDTRLEWVYGDTEHCNSCARLNGIVKRASFWVKHGVQPGNPPNEKLECGGWRCQCNLVPSESRLSPGKLPRLP